MSAQIMNPDLPAPMSAANTPEIRTRADFTQMLATTLAEVDGLATREPAYPVWTNLQGQLRAMQEWTAHGADPTPAQLGRISIGLLAARELEPAVDAAMESLITRLHLLSYYWRHWPSPLSPTGAAPPVIPPAATRRSAGPWLLNWPRLSPPPAATKVWLVTSLVLFVAACCLPALEFRNSHRPNDIMSGLRALAIGWSGIFAGVFAWYANPCWFLSLVLGFFRRPLAAALVGVVAIALAASTVSLVGRELPGDEGNVTRTTVIRLLPGCHLWMATMALLPLVAFLPGRNQPRERAA